MNCFHASLLNKSWFPVSVTVLYYSLSFDREATLKENHFSNFFSALSKNKWCSIQTFLSFNVCQQVCFGTFQGSKNQDKCESGKELIQIIGPVQRIETCLKKKRN